MSIRKVRIRAGEGYDVIIGQGLLDMCGEYVRSVHEPCKAAVITDSTVEKLYLDRVLRSLQDAGFSTAAFSFPQGESSKNLGTLSDILEFMAESSLTRSDIAVALGGGVTGDITGFAAGVYQRGIQYAQIPTTLLAAVDSSVGGKTAVDLKAGKNMAGVFLQPSLVICDTDTFGTLSPEIFADGAAETIKYGVLTDRDLFDLFGSGDVMSSLPDIISRCVAIKGAVVERDPYDNGDRRYLNLGHTMGHAIEKVSGYSFPHGHAVAVGMVMAARYGERLGVTKPGTSDEISRVLEKNLLPVSSPYSSGELFEAARSDKKRRGGSISVIMIEEIGKCFIKTMPVENLREFALLGKE